MNPITVVIISFLDFVYNLLQLVIVELCTDPGLLLLLTLTLVELTMIPLTLLVVVVIVFYFCCLQTHHHIVVETFLLHFGGGLTVVVFVEVVCFGGVA